MSDKLNGRHVGQDKWQVSDKVNGKVYTRRTRSMTGIVLEIGSNLSDKINGKEGLTVGQNQWRFVGQDKRKDVGQVRIMQEIA